MQILIATGMYPPDIGGTATYAEAIARELKLLGHAVTVMTYGDDSRPALPGLSVVPRRGRMLARWLRYAKELKKCGKDADAIIALSSVSVGVPLLLARLQIPRKILRLGGEFFWERYTDAGGLQSLRQWHARGWGFWRLIDRCVMPWILGSFDTIVYSTNFQRKIHRDRYPWLRNTVVIENALQRWMHGGDLPTQKKRQVPFRLLSMGRFVGFKNLGALIDAMAELPDATLTIVGDGPFASMLRGRVAACGAADRIQFLQPVHGRPKQEIFASHDLLVIPSITDISPNTALEACATGLPVLLTEETGLSDSLARNMVLMPLQTPTEIVVAIRNIMERYADIAKEMVSPTPERPWSHVAREWMAVLLPSSLGFAVPRPASEDGYSARRRSDEIVR